jgi:hypothetical protein
MKAKFYFLAGLLGGITLFVWGALTHMAIPFWEDVMHQIPNEQAVVDAMKNAGVQNGIYYGNQGLFLVTFFGKGMADGISMGPLMLIEFITDVIVALFLAWILMRAAVNGVWARARFALVVGLMAWVAINVSYWNWYNFPFAYIVLEFVDTGLGMLVGGLVIAWLVEKQHRSIPIEPTRARAVA